MKNHTNTQHRRQRGFTLIELMCVLCIVGMLALVAYPSYRSIVIKAKRSEAHAALMQAMLQQERFFSQHNRYQTYSAANANAFKWYSGETAAASAYQLSAAACPSDVIEHCVLLSATPGGPEVNVNFRDEECRTLTLNSLGEKTAAGLPAASAPQVCW